MTVRVTADGGVSEVNPPLSNEAVVTTSGTVVDSASGEEAGKASKIGEQQLYGAQMRQRVQQQARVPIYDGSQPAPGTTNEKAWIPVDAPERELCFDVVLALVPKEMRDTAQIALFHLLDSARAAGLTAAQLAYVLATVQHESSFGLRMNEIWGPTAVQRGYEGRRRLGNTQPGDGYRFRGRGYVQVTGRANYAYWTKRLGIDLVNDPDLATMPEVAAVIAVWGMRDGTFTGKRLSQFINDRQQDFYNARRVVNDIRSRVDREVARDIATNARRYFSKELLAARLKDLRLSISFSDTRAK